MNKPIKTVQATCACGATFSREVKRGRPQVWCPVCVLVPFYERQSLPTLISALTEIVVDSGVVGTGLMPERIVNENDRLDAVRVEIETGMAAINADHKVRYAALVASGLSTFDAADKAQAVTHSATANLYAELASQFYKPGREIEDV